MGAEVSLWVCPLCWLLQEVRTEEASKLKVAVLQHFGCQLPSDLRPEEEEEEAALMYLPCNLLCVLMEDVVMLKINQLVTDMLRSHVRMHTSSFRSRSRATCCGCCWNFSGRELAGRQNRTNARSDIQWKVIEGPSEFLLTAERERERKK